MQLGQYAFSLDSAAYQTLSQRQAFRWQPQARLGRRPAQQYTGPDAQSITLKGTLYPHFRGGPKTLDPLRDDAEQGRAHMLVDGTGRVWGLWVINRIDETQTLFSANGVPQKITFTLQLTQYGEDDALPHV